MDRFLQFFGTRKRNFPINEESCNSPQTMGFAVEPMERDEKCLAFVMPLKSPERKVIFVKQLTDAEKRGA